ncbi:hypothetical protein D3C87_1549770 [compost metagenome]
MAALQMRPGQEGEDSKTHADGDQLVVAGDGLEADRKQGAADNGDNNHRDHGHQDQATGNGQPFGQPHDQSPQQGLVSKHAGLPPTSTSI